MDKSKDMDRVDLAGLVNVGDEKAVGKVPLHYCHGKWFGPNRDGGFSCYKDSQASSLIGQHGFNRTIKNEMGNTPAEIVMLWLMQNRSVNYAGPLAGYPVGPHCMGEQRVLVTEVLRLVQPKAGKWPVIQLLVESLLADKEHDQVTFYYVWQSASLRNLYWRIKSPGLLPFTHCPALALFGEFQSGKSALIDLVLTPLFGGRKADPLAFLRDGKFNKDLFPAALLVMDDKGAAANLEERRQRGDSLKSLIWSEFQRMEGKGVDALMVPTAPGHPSFIDVAADPLGANAALGTYTNFVNLLGWCALALPAGTVASGAAGGLPFGVTVIAQGNDDAALVNMGRAWQQSTGLPLGATGVRLSEEVAAPWLRSPAVRASLPIAVVGAHLSGMPLNGQVIERGARLLVSTSTASHYRLYALPGTTPPKPGLIRVAKDGSAIAVEVWDMPAANVGSFLALIPAPLGIGSIELADGRWVHGFLCEAHALAGAEDISHFGGWRAYMQSLSPAAATAKAAKTISSS